MAKVRKDSPERTEWNWWTRNIFSRRSVGMLCRKSKLQRRSAQAPPVRQLSLLIKIATALWAPSRWIRMEISLQRLQPAARQTSARDAWAILRLSERALTPITRHAPSPPRGTASILFERRQHAMYRP